MLAVVAPEKFRGGAFADELLPHGVKNQRLPGSCGGVGEGAERGGEVGDDGGEIAAYPVSPAQRAEQRARAARLGLAAGSDELPGEALGGRLPQDAAPPAGATALAATGGRPERNRGGGG